MRRFNIYFFASALVRGGNVIREVHADGPGRQTDIEWFDDNGSTFDILPPILRFVLVCLIERGADALGEKDSGSHSQQDKMKRYDDIQFVFQFPSRSLKDGFTTRETRSFENREKNREMRSCVSKASKNNPSSNNTQVIVRNKDKNLFRMRNWQVPNTKHYF
jgi:hypothetical protein